MKYYVVKDGDAWEFSVVGVTTNRDLAERYCAVHDTYFDEYEDSKGLELSPEEQSMPINTQLDATWDLLTGSVEYANARYTVDEPEIWTVTPKIGTAVCTVRCSAVLSGKRDISTREKTKCLAAIETEGPVSERADEFLTRHKECRKAFARKYLLGKIDRNLSIMHGGICGQRWYNKRATNRLTLLYTEINKANADTATYEHSWWDEIQEVIEEDTGVKFEMSPLMKANFQNMKLVMKERGYFYSGLRIREMPGESDVRLLFCKYGLDKDEDKSAIAFSYVKLKEKTEAGVFEEWFEKAIKDLFEGGEANA